MSNGYRHQIKVAIRDKLAAITQENGYNHNIKRSTYAFVPYSTVTEFPMTCLIAGVANYTPLTNNEYTSGNERLATDGWPIMIIGYVKGDTASEKFTTEMDNLVEDIVECMLDDHTLGLSPFVLNCYLQSIDEEIDINQNIGSVLVTFNVKYDFNKDTA